MKIKRGSTSVRRLIFIADTSQTNGAGLANLVFNSSGLVAYYIAGDLNNEVQITLVSATLGTFTSGGFVAVDNTNMPGWYEIGIPDAALDGGNEVAIQLRGATNMAPVNIYIELDAVDYQSATNFGLSKFADIETDTQDIQSRLPSGLVDGRMAAIAQVVGDKTGYKLASDGLTANNAGDPIADIVWDEVLTGATHNVASSAGRRLRQLASVIVRAGTAQGSGTGNNQIQLDAGASSTNGDYDPGLIFIETGTGAGQARLILQYNGSTKVATVDRDWRVNPDNTSEFVILADAGRNSVNEGLAQGGTSTTITLNASASSSDDAYNGQLVFIRSGTGQDQVGLVEDYVGSTKVATIRTRSATGQWATVPDTTSAYMMIPNLTFTLSEISGAVADGVWDEATSGHTTAGTTGKALIDSGAAGNPWSTDLATGYSGTQAGNILNNVKSQTDLIQAGGTVTVSTPVTASGQLASPLIIGDDYLAANGRRFRWTVELPSGYVIATSTARFGMRYEDEQGINSFIATGTVTDATGGNVHLDFDVAKTVTGTLRPGWYEWSVEIVSASGTRITRVKSGKNAEWQEKQT
jgi:hypothetical protein